MNRIANIAFDIKLRFNETLLYELEIQVLFELVYGISYDQCLRQRIPTECHLAREEIF